MYRGILEAIRNMSTDDVVNLHNNYCKAVNDMDGVIYPMELLDEEFTGINPLELAKRFHDGDGNPYDNYFRSNSYECIETFNYWDDENSGIFVENIADYIAKSFDDLGNDEVAEILRNGGKETA